MSSRFFSKEGNSLVFRNNGETLVLTPWNENALRVRSAMMSEVEDSRWALLDPTFEGDAPITIEDATASITCGKLTATITVEPEILLAPITKAELMNSFRKISSYTTSTTSNSNRNTNVSLSAQAINGTTVLSGEIFSFNNATGQRTEEKGYKAAAAISGGQSVN